MTRNDYAAPISVWLISPYHTGSHKAWAEGYKGHSRHDVKLFTLAGRFWKWRMQGAAVELAAQTEKLCEVHPPDLILATDMTNLPAWLALMRRVLPAQARTALYMHENQLTYPWRPGEKPDLTYAMVNWLSQLCADMVVFNTEFHRRSWFAALPNLLKHFPDYNHLDKIEEVEARSHVMPVGIDVQPESHRRDSSGLPLILWNQRWEYDKRPDRFFRLLYRLEEAGHNFRLGVAGENFRNVPVEFEEAAKRLAHRIDHWGFLTSRKDYLALLRKADIVISTADHEFFGISILEAIQAGSFRYCRIVSAIRNWSPPICTRPAFTKTRMICTKKRSRAWTCRVGRHRHFASLSRSVIAGLSLPPLTITNSTSFCERTRRPRSRQRNQRQR